MTISHSLLHKNFLLIALIIFLAIGCLLPFVEQKLPEGKKNVKRLFFANYGWHSALVMKRADIQAAILPEIRDFPDAEYLEFGWGDRAYYQAADPGFFLALKAAFFSGGSVLHVVGFKGPVAGVFSNTEMIELGASEEAFQQLVKYISQSFSRTPETSPAEVRPGLHANSRFYPATGRFHLFRTCNTWVASALHAAGFPVSPASAVTAGSLSRQVREIGGLSRLRGSHGNRAPNIGSPAGIRQPSVTFSQCCPRLN